MSDIVVYTYCLDDSELFLDVINEYFKEYGITHYRLFTNYDQFISAVNRDVRICVIDHSLSNRMTGIQAVRHVKQISKGCYFIILSGMDDVDVVIDYLNEGIYKYIRKTPDCLNQLVNHIHLATDEIKRKLVFLEELNRFKDAIE